MLNLETSFVRCESRSLDKPPTPRPGAGRFHRVTAAACPSLSDCTMVIMDVSIAACRSVDSKKRRGPPIQASRDWSHGAKPCGRVHWSPPLGAFNLPPVLDAPLKACCSHWHSVGGLPAVLDLNA